MPTASGRLCPILFAAIIFYALTSLMPASAAADITTGLVGWWKMDEGTSTIAHDFSGHGYTATTSAAIPAIPRWVSGKLGNAFQFDGSTNYLQSKPINLSQTQTITLAFWGKFPSFANTSYQTLFSRASQARAWVVTFVVEFDNAANGDCPNAQPQLLISEDGDTQNTAGCYVPPSTNAWHHYVAIFDKSTNPDSVKLYIDGILQTPDSTDIHNNTDVFDNLPLYMGAYFDGTAASQFTQGAIDDVRIYSRALSASDVAQLYASGAAFIRKPANMLGLVGWWRFDEGTSTTAHDSSGYGNNGKLTINTSILPQWVSGKLGNALSFPGDGYIPTNNTALNGASKFTVSFWEKPHVFTGAGGFVAWDVNLNSTQNTTTFGTQGVSYNGYSNTFAATIEQSYGSNVVGTVTKSNFPADVWYHYVAVYDGSQGTDATKLKIYLNGVQQTLAFDVAVPATSFNGGYRLQIGGNTTWGSINGIMDDVRIYNRALSATEVANMYQSGGSKIASAADLTSNTSLSSGLIGYWTFDGKDTRWSSATAGTVTDRSGNNNGTLTNMTRAGSPTIGKLGQGLKFDGSSSYIATNNTTLNGASQFTVSFWEKPTVFGGSANFIASELGSGAVTSFGTQGPSCNGYSKTFAATISIGGGGNVVGTVTQSNFPAGVWYHYVAVFDGTQTGDSNRLKVYLNGVELVLVYDSAVPAVAFNDGFTLKIGCYSASCFNGTMDDVRVYNRSLTPDEIRQLYKLGQANLHP